MGVTAKVVGREGQGCQLAGKDPMYKKTWHVSPATQVIVGKGGQQRGRRGTRGTVGHCNGHLQQALHRWATPRQQDIKGRLLRMLSMA